MILKISNILFILNGNSTGGVLVSELKLIDYLKSLGYEVDGIITGNGGAKEKYENTLNRYYDYVGMKYSNSGIRVINLMYNIFERIRITNYTHNLKLTKDYDLIIYSTPSLDLLAARIGDINKCKVIWYMPKPMRNIIEKTYYQIIIKRNSILPIANSQYTKNSLGDICKNYVYPGYSKERIVNSRKVLRDKSIRYKFGVDENDIVFGIAARIVKRRSQHKVIKAFIDLIKRYSNIHLIIAGGPLDSKYAEYCKQISKEHKDKIHFIGYVENMVKFYSNIDIYINCIEGAEGFGLSVAEAMGSSLPVISYKKGGPFEMIVSEYNGWLMENTSVKSYHDVIEIAINSKRNFNVMGERSKINSEKFEFEYNAKKFIEIITKISVQY